MKTERIKWIDVAKGMCIFLVVFGHCVTREGIGKVAFLNRLIYSFHMPLFFILSGINLKTDVPFIDFVKKRIIKVLLPTYGFVILYNICMAGISIFDGSYTHYVAQISAGNAVILGKSLLCLRDSLVANWWFLPALFTAQIILFMINKISNGFLKLAVFVICLFICMLNYHTANSAFPFFLETSALALPFLAIGFYGKTLLNKDGKVIGFAVAILVWLISIFASVKCGYGAMSMWNCDIHNLPLFLAGGISGSYIIVYFAKKMENVNIFSRLGKETLWVYGIHYIFLNIFCEAVEGYVKNPSFIENLLIVFIGTVIIFFCCYFVLFLKGKVIGLRNRDKR